MSEDIVMRAIELSDSKILLKRHYFYDNYEDKSSYFCIYGELDNEIDRELFKEGTEKATVMLPTGNFRQEIKLKKEM